MDLSTVCKPATNARNPEPRLIHSITMMTTGSMVFGSVSHSTGLWMIPILSKNELM